MDDRRQFSRILFASEAHLNQSDKIWATKILDLSLNGALVEEPAGFAPLADPLLLRFRIADSDIEVQMEAQLAHRENGQLGLTCTHIDVDSISHLRRLIELNQGDSALLNRELEHFIDVHDKQD